MELLYSKAVRNLKIGIRPLIRTAEIKNFENLIEIFDHEIDNILGILERRQKKIHEEQKELQNNARMMIEFVNRAKSKLILAKETNSQLSIGEIEWILEPLNKQPTNRDVK